MFPNVYASLIHSSLLRIETYSKLILSEQDWKLLVPLLRLAKGPSSKGKH